MRNEGPFIVEWVTWYRLLGFGDVVVVTNNCTDHSPDLLDALAAAGWLHHIRHDVAEGKPITAPKLKAARAQLSVRKADWVLVCDVDEFLVIHKGAGKLADLLPGGVPEFLGMAINWRVFGSDGQQKWADGLVHRQFFGALRVKRGLSQFVKTIFRKPLWFSALGEHGPRKLKLRRAGREWGAPGMNWVNSAGQPVGEWQPGGDYLRSLPPKRSTHEVAQINHYMLRSEETFSLKRGTLSPVGRKDRYTAAYQQQANHADEIDASALRNAGEFDVLHAQAMALPDVRRLHHLCCADHVRLICEKAGCRVGDDPRWHQHLALAAE